MPPFFFALLLPGSRLFFAAAPRQRRRQPPPLRTPPGGSSCARHREEERLRPRRQQQPRLAGRGHASAPATNPPSPFATTLLILRERGVRGEGTQRRRSRCPDPGKTPPARVGRTQPGETPHSRAFFAPSPRVAARRCAPAIIPLSREVLLGLIATRRLQLFAAKKTAAQRGLRRSSRRGMGGKSELWAPFCFARKV